MDVKVSVIIPTYNDWERLSLCLDAIQNQSYPSEQIQIIVANNNPANTVPEKYNIPYNCQIIDVSIPGSYAARNAALELAENDIIAFTDSDCIPHRDWLKNAVEYLSKHDTIYRIAGKIEILPNDSRDGSLQYEKLFAFKQEKISREGLSVTANLITYKELFTGRVGLFNQSYFSGGDMEWNKRATALGYQIAYLENSVVYHPARSIDEILRKVRRIYAQDFKNKNTSKFYLFFSGVYNLRPPVIAFSKIFRQKQVGTIKDRLKVMNIFYRKNIAAFEEHYRILFGGEQPRE